MEINLDLPYITKDLPGVGGQLRLTPRHFIVEEIPLYEPNGEGPHLYINITKEGLTTKEIQEKLAVLFNCLNSDIGYAGLKDKHARTTQTFSVLLGNVDNNSINDMVQQIKGHLPVIINWAKLHRNKLKPGHLLGNRFTIKVTNTNLNATKSLEYAQEIADHLKKNGVPNFFGPQRFGFDGENIQKGIKIIQGKNLGIDPWLRRFLISSYQSYLCNRYLTNRLKSDNYYRILMGDIAKKYSTGGLFQVKDPQKEQSRYENHEISFTSPIYGSKMWDATGPAGKLEEEILNEAEITLQQFDYLKIKGTRRLGRLLITDLNVSLENQDLLVEFFLPKGAFATTVLREFMKNDE
ncbi:MAG: tRNA pseudouridine(13) synthase TruD [Candidatus Bathyarchaeia archaeon]